MTPGAGVHVLGRGPISHVVTESCFFHYFFQIFKILFSLRINSGNVKLIPKFGNEVQIGETFEQDGLKKIWDTFWKFSKITLLRSEIKNVFIYNILMHSNLHQS